MRLTRPLYCLMPFDAICGASFKNVVMSTEINDEIIEKHESSSSQNDSENVTKSDKRRLSDEDEEGERHVDKKAKKCESQEGDQSSSTQQSDLLSDSAKPSSGDNDNLDNTGEKTDHSNVVASHYNALEEKGLTQRNQSRIVYMRNFNNWMKSMLINEYLDKIRQGKSYGDPVRVLDMCCGKGGDLLKWRKANISHLICADIAEVSVEQCQNRYKEMSVKRYPPLFTAEFLACDCTKVRLREKYKDPSLQLDLVSCQFAFHYSFESLPQAECMLKNAAESLRPGGYFIGTIPNAKELVTRWRNIDGNKFGNDIYSIEFQCDKNNIPLFGAKYNFRLEEVVNCPEFLVHLPTLQKLAWKFGLELVMFERFGDFFDKKKEEGKTLISRMQALETYPPYHEAPLLANNSQEYQHAVEYMQNSTGHRKIGTLSQSEWEATSLYSVFAFQKAKTNWTAEGKPEYVKF